MKTKYIITETIIILFIILWVYAGLSKLIDYNNFKIQLGQSPYITGWHNLIAFILPVSELLIAFLLIIKKWQKIGLYLSFFLMILFTGYIFIMLRFSHYIPCSCGGVLSKMSWGEHLVFNIIFCVLAILGILLRQDQPSRLKSIQLL